MSATRVRRGLRGGGEAGFTLIEMLIAVVLMGFILASLATVTAQWLPNWRRGMARVQQTERLAFALKRVVEDLSAAEIVTANKAAKTPVFEGTQLAVTFVRTAVGPNSHPGLELVRFHEAPDTDGPALVRDRAAFTPMPSDTVLQFADPVVLIRSPYRVTFAYAGQDGAWQPTWRDQTELPRSIRIAVRDGVTEQTLALSTTALLHIDAPAECVRSQSIGQCLGQPKASEGEATAQAAGPGTKSANP